MYFDPLKNTLIHAETVKRAAKIGKPLMYQIFLEIHFTQLYHHLFEIIFSNVASILIRK